jgi:uncharacterized protein YnzC (UPF0291/DUF896 family)
MIDHAKLSRNEQNAILKQHGYRWQYLEDASEEAEEEIAGWVLIDPSGERVRVEDAFARINEQTEPTADESGPMYFDSEPSGAQEVKDRRERGWNARYDGALQKWYLSVYDPKLRKQRRITVVEYKAIHPDIAAVKLQIEVPAEIFGRFGSQESIQQKFLEWLKSQ